MLQSTNTINFTTLRAVISCLFYSRVVAAATAHSADSGPWRVVTDAVKQDRSGSCARPCPLLDRLRHSSPASDCVRHNPCELCPANVMMRSQHLALPVDAVLNLIDQLTSCLDSNSHEALLILQFFAS